MHFLDIAGPLPSLQVHLGIYRPGSLVDDRALPSSSIYKNKTRPVASWKSLSIPIKVHSNAESFKFRSDRMVVKAVASTETREHEKGNKNSLLEIGSSSASESANGNSAEVGERERLRRMRISRANKGRLSWNKGRKHSAETLRRISERTKMAMQDPKKKKKFPCSEQVYQQQHVLQQPQNQVKMKLKPFSPGHAHSDDTKAKIGAAARRRWLRHHEKLLLQETCHFEWQNLIAEASRKGYGGEEELLWDSYEILDEQLHKEWLESLAPVVKVKGSGRVPKSPEQRRKIAEAIAAKWTDPEYRGRVLHGISRYRGTSVRTESNRPKKKAIETQISSEGEATSKTQKPKKRSPPKPLHD